MESVVNLKIMKSLKELDMISKIDDVITLVDRIFVSRHIFVPIYHENNAILLRYSNVEMLSKYYELILDFLLKSGIDITEVSKAINLNKMKGEIRIDINDLSKLKYVCDADESKYDTKLLREINILNTIIGNE